ncbi:electron transport complex, rnfabcdge type, G subunit [Helcococcus kunzii ATCC 51366]|uniref:Electron transport complex, rnfabcdge type, G subunit n=1 Tax=Helcococcus kunzii ATCC 51366 TaxID=883114 RepID=H3NMM9_9FIRM|nr:FMN-binding protein [Helcococcus kunzii]EHR34773.1 electron transport complex, rnfabcdge type, G subunit [Helcococcus kunzii ATCC 51366]
MKKSTSLIKTLLIAVVAIALVFGANKLLEPLQQKVEGNSEFASVFPEGKDFKEIEFEKTESINKVYEVTDGSNAVGYVFDATVPQGYGGPINFLIGITKEGIIKGIEVLEQSETEGFGAAIATSEFAEGVKDVNVSKGVSAGEKDVEKGQIEAISGATITTNAFLDELKTVVNLLSTLSENVEQIVEEKPYYVEKYEELLDDSLSNYTFEELKLNEESPEVYNANLNRIIKVVGKDGKLNSYILQMSTKGYGGNIDILTRINDEYRVFKSIFPSQNETPDLGGYIDDEVYKNSLVGLNLDKNFLTKAIKLRENPTGEKDILLISGATITSQAIQKAFDGAIEGLVQFDKVKNDEKNFEKLDVDALMEASEDDKGSKYNHAEAFEAVDSSKPLDKGTNDEVIAVSQAYAGDKEIGRIIDVNVDGFAGVIEYGLLVSNEGIVEDFKVYNHSETEGYGAEIAEDSFKDKIKGLDLSKTKEFKNGDNIEGISGATFTTDGLIKGLNSAVKAFADSKDAKVVENADSNQDGKDANSNSSTEHDYKSFKGVDEVKDVDFKSNDKVIKVVDALSEGKEIGRIYDAKTTGFGGDIEFGLLISKDGKIEDLVIYNQSETEGFGAVIQEDGYKNNIVGKNIKEIESVDDISGATITSEGMSSAYKAILEVYESLGQ